MGERINKKQAMHYLEQDFQYKYSEDLKNVLRMCEDVCVFIGTDISTSIQKKDTHNIREAIPAKKLMITLLYLATGDSFKSLQFSLRLFFQFPGVRASQILKFSNYVCSCKIWLI